MREELKVLQLAREVVDELNQLLNSTSRRMIYVNQLREAGGSITGNIKEAYGRKNGPDRKHFLRIARGSAEETDERLRANFADNRVAARTYWRLHNRLVLTCKMLTAMTDQDRS
jgi:four helix bundle protein